MTELALTPSQTSGPYLEIGLIGGPITNRLVAKMFRNLIPTLADRYHVIAPDYPGYGQSDAPDHTKFDYTFARCADLMDGLMGQLVQQ